MAEKYLDRVTITGADDSVKVSDLVHLTERYPFVEWGILVSRSHTGKVGEPRWPSLAWMEELRERTLDLPIRLSLHICGSWLRNLLLGVNEIPGELFTGFQRVQLNTHAEALACNELKFLEILDGEQRQVIFQIDGRLGGSLMQTVLDRNAKLHLPMVEREFAKAGVAMGSAPLPIDVAALFDVSHGAGVLPSEWPDPRDVNNAWRAHAESLFLGYAGGLGPDNLEEQLPRIAAAAGEVPFWIDMETRVRSSNDRLFDLGKVERCLQIAQPFIKEQQ